MSTHQIRSMVALAAILTLAACAANPAGPRLEPGDEPETPSNPPNVEVADARELWEAEGPADYRFLVRRECFCGNTGDFVVVVEDGVTVAARRAETGEAVEMLEDLPSVDGLFDLLEAALSRPADRVLAEFDEDLGFPTSIDIDPDFQVSDDEVSYRILELPTDR